MAKSSAFAASKSRLRSPIVPTISSIVSNGYSSFDMAWASKVFKTSRSTLKALDGPSGKENKNSPPLASTVAAMAVLYRSTLPALAIKVSLSLSSIHEYLLCKGKRTESNASGSIFGAFGCFWTSSSVGFVVKEQPARLITNRIKKDRLITL
ncbi:MAG: hypothetical protein BWX66_02086 [Deltaproteobacteria bacterium ADurb.Bin058]|nr:MAG: hypothetical protein BWX66_02086 [Deltaproteobacteria bacterium ADurb.Bin058]